MNSSAGAGSTFWFSVPLKTTTETISVPATVEYLRNRRLLAVDDNGTNRSILKQQLGKIGMIVTCAASGREALNVVAAGVPSGTGHLNWQSWIFTCRWMNWPHARAGEIRRRENAISSTPLMMLTSDRDRDEAATARELGVKLFLVKPVRQANLIRAVGEMFGAISLDPQPSRAVESDGLNARILVVEDNATNQRVIVLRLEKFGCSVEVAHNGYEAVQAGSSGPVSMQLST